MRIDDGVSWGVDRVVGDRVITVIDWQINYVRGGIGVKVYDSVVWGVGRVIGDKVVRYIGGRVEIYVGDEVGEVVECGVWGKVVLINMSKMKSMWIFMTV